MSKLSNSLRLAVKDPTLDYGDLWAYCEEAADEIEYLESQVPKWNPITEPPELSSSAWVNGKLLHRSAPVLVSDERTIWMERIEVIEGTVLSRAKWWTDYKGPTWSNSR